MSNIKIKFEANQQHQIKAVESVLGLFKGMPKQETVFQLGDDIIPNLPAYQVLEEHWLDDNLREVQNEFNNYTASIGSSSRIVHPDIRLQVDDGFLLEDVGEDFENHRYPTYTVDMETGTGKTYVYLRTIHELRKNYGFRKFIIVVPSVAIYEGVIKSFDMTKEHFKSLYGNETVGLTKYDGQQISKIRNFATSAFTEVMVITLDSFNKSSNLFYKSTEKLPGERKPFQYVQETRPILILDESQNYRSPISRTALRTLKPLFAINYSATPGTAPEESPNIIFKLTPVDAFRLNLVKKIQVWGITEDYNVNDPQLNLALNSIGSGSYGLSAKFRTLVNEGGRMVEKTIELKKNEELYSKTKNPAHKGIVIDSINKKEGIVVFADGNELVLKEDANNLSVSKQEIFRLQIERTIQEHFARQKALKPKGIKVLSLFFIDKVANYVNEDGIIKQLFDEAFERLKRKDDHFKKLKAEEVRNGYFAKKKEQFVDTAVADEKKTKEQREMEKAAYKLIMTDKERLLNFDEKVSFIFAHSALREGWDNPNVFQICTLNTSVSENRKRQEIGRGLRLCVNQKGDRVQDEGVNILTVVANESYRSYVESLQREYIESGDLVPPKPSSVTTSSARRNDKVFRKKEFRQFWESLCKKTEYKINIDSAELVQNCIDKFNNHQFHFPEPRIIITKGQFIINTYDIELKDVKVGMAKISLKITDTHGGDLNSTQWFKKGADLSLIANRDENLKGFKIVKISSADDEAEVVFGNGKSLDYNNSIHFEYKRNVETDPKMVQEQQTTYPVFNLIDRTSKELGITRTSILQIFKGIDSKKKAAIFKNPEGFSATFISTIKEILTDHIAEKIEYSLGTELNHLDMQECFPELKKYPQRELIDGSRNSLYDQIQIDSDVEMRFVENRLKEDDELGNIICYFKFPGTFKVNIPRIIGNYNPDWGIIRIGGNGKPELRLVRETKGNVDTSKLRFTNEGRKIECAEKHFAAIGIDYRTVDDKIETWWLPSPKTTKT